MAEIDAFNAMVDELKADDPIFLPSAFWQDLSSKNARMLEIEGLANFKRTVSQNYFNWFIDGPAHPLFRHAFIRWCRHPNLLPFVSRLQDTEYLRLTTSDERIGLSRLQRLMYRLYVSFVWTIMVAHDRHHLHDKIAEPEIGNPFRVMVGDRVLSQDLANSIIECNLIADLPKASSSPRIAELGAGYGRLAHTTLTMLPGQYFIFDIRLRSVWHSGTLIKPLAQIQCSTSVTSITSKMSKTRWRRLRPRCLRPTTPEISRFLF